MLLEGVNLAAKTASYLKKVSNLFRRPCKIPIFSGPWFAWSGIWRCAGHHDWWGYSWLLLRHSQVIIMVMENGNWLSYLRSVKTGAWQVSQLTGEEEPPMSIAGHVDVGEQYNCIINLFSWTEVLYLTNMCSGVWTSCVNHHWAALPQNNSAGVSQFSPAMYNILNHSFSQINCPNCERTLAASRWELKVCSVFIFQVCSSSGEVHGHGEELQQGGKQKACYQRE